jgi:sigma-54 dependent transcriptional regulator, acetoin dehydrogenase operon transcriptional activator AcoR
MRTTGFQVWGAPPDDPRREEFSELGLREDIHLSWRRSRQALAPMDKMDVPYGELDDDDRRLLRAIGPVLARFAEHLTDTRFSLVLADRNGRVVHTFAGEDKERQHLAALSIDQGFVLSEGAAGTNGIGTVLEERRPVLVVGDEHYSEPLRHLICAGTPIRSPITGRLEGVLDLACPLGEWSKLISPALAQLRHDVEHELATTAPLTQRLIFERFAARCRETSAAVIGVSDQYMITNAAATDLLSPADQGVIWAALSQDSEGGGVQGITLSNGRTIDAKSQVIRLGGSTGGHLVELAARPDNGQSRPRRTRVAITVESILDDVVRANPQRLLILGERGVGKVTAAQQVHQRLNGEQPITMLSCELSRVADEQSWLGELAAHLQRTEETVVLRHVDLLAEPVAQAVVALLDRCNTGRTAVQETGPGAASNQGPRVMATASDRIPQGWSSALREALGEQTVQLPPLRDRRPEIATLAASMLKDIAPRVHVSGRALAALQNYDWPGNFAQLRSVLDQSAKTAGGHLIGLEHLPGEIAGALRGRQALTRIEELEREAIIAALREQHGNKVRAAEALGMSRSTFYRRLRQLRLDPSALLA